MIRRRPLTGVLRPRRHEHDDQHEHEHDDQHEHEREHAAEGGSGHEGTPTSPEHQHERLNNSRAW